MMNLSIEKNPRLRRTIAILPVLALVAACTEDERACYDRISADLDQSAELATKSGNQEHALIARESAITASAIWIDDDRNICDYVTAGAFLQHK